MPVKQADACVPKHMKDLMLSLNIRTIQHVDLYVMEKAPTQEALVCMCLVVSNSVLSLLKQLLMPVTSG
jgi:hypothetical protein